MKNQNLILLIYLFLYSLNYTNNLKCSKNKVESTQTIAGNLINDAPFQIISKSSKLCITAGSGQNKRLIMEFCALGRKNQLWQKIAYEANHFGFINSETNMVIDLQCDLKDVGAIFIEWPLTDRPNQIFRMEKLSDDSYRLIVRLTGLCAEGGNSFQQSTCNTSDSQKWFLREVKLELPTGFAYVKSRRSNKCIQFNGANNKLTQMTCVGNRDSQSFIFYLREDDGSYQIGINTGQFWDNINGASNNGNPLFVYNLNWSGAQRFYITPIDEQYVAFVNKDSKKCVDNTGSTAENIGIHQWDCDINNINQHFSIGESNIDPIPEGSVQIRIKNGTKCVMFAGSTSRLTLNECTENNGLMAWKISPEGDGSFTINSLSGMRIDNQGSTNALGNPILAYKINEADNQRWYIIPRSNGAGFYIINKQYQNRCIDWTGTAKDGLNIQLWECLWNNDRMTFEFVNSEIKPVPEGWILIKNERTKKCATAYSWNTMVRQKECNYKDLTQLWQISQNDDGTYNILTVSGQIMDNNSSYTYDGNPVLLYKPGNGDNQKWLIFSLSEDTYTIMNFQTSKCLEIPYKEDTANYYQFTCNRSGGSEQQLFKFVEHDDIEIYPPGFMQILNEDTGKCLGITGKNTRTIEVNCNTNDARQSWRLSRRKDGVFEIVSYLGFNLDLGVGNQVWGYVKNEADNQKWFIVPEKPGFFKFVNLKHNTCLEIISGIVLSGACDNLKRQFFKFKTVNAYRIPKDYMKIQYSQWPYRSATFSWRDSNIKLFDSDSDQSGRQGWILISNGDGTVSISNAYGYNFDNSGDKLVDGNPVLSYQANNGDNQKWLIVPINDQFQYLIMTYQGSFCLTITNNVNGNNFVVMQCDPSKSNQRFKFSISNVTKPPAGFFLLKNKLTGKCLKQNLIHNQIIQTNCAEYDGSATWYLNSIGGGLFNIRSSSNYNIDFLNGWSHNNNQVYTYLAENGSNQQFWIKPNNGKFAQFVGKDNKCIRVENANTGLTIFDCQDLNDSQLWEMVPTNFESLPAGWFQILNIKSGRCWKAPGGWTAIVQGDCLKSDVSTYFRVIKTDQESYFINLYSGQFIDLSGSRWENGTEFLSWPGNWGINQKFWIYPEKNMWMFINRTHNKCADVPGGQTNLGLKIDQWDCDKASPNLKFTLIPI